MKQENRGIVLLDDNLSDLIERYRIDGYNTHKHILSRSEAIRILVVSGLKAKGYDVSSVSDDKLPDNTVQKSATSPKKPAQVKNKYDWPALYAEFKASGMTQAAFSQKKGIGKSEISRNFKKIEAQINTKTDKEGV